MAIENAVRPGNGPGRVAKGASLVAAPSGRPTGKPKAQYDRVHLSSGAPASPLPAAPSRSAQQKGSLAASILRYVLPVAKDAMEAAGPVFNGWFTWKAAKLIASGEPAGTFLSKVFPGLAIAGGALSAETTIAHWNRPFNKRHWDDVLRLTGDALQVAGGVACFVPAIGTVPGMLAITAGSVLSTVGTFADDDTSEDITRRLDLFPTADNVAAFQHEMASYATNGSITPWGSSPKQVQGLQRLLVDLGADRGYGVKVNGQYDTPTQQAVRAFKHVKGICQSYRSADGTCAVNEVADPRTLAALRKAAG